MKNDNAGFRFDAASPRPGNDRTVETLQWLCFVGGLILCMFVIQHVFTGEDRLPLLTEDVVGEPQHVRQTLPSRQVNRGLADHSAPISPAEPI